MTSCSVPEECAKQWEILLLLISSEEKKIDRTGETEVDTMNYFCNNEGIRKILLQWLKDMQNTYGKKISDSDTALKCDDVSLLWRQRGNEKFRANALEESYKCYTKSVIYANQNGPMYPLALANRSAVLLRMKRFEECLSDVAMAIDSGYPADLRQKLFLRRADCHIELGRQDHARAALREAIDHAATLKLSASYSAELDRHVQLLQKKLAASAGPGAGARAAAEERDVLPPCYKGPNHDFLAASSAIQLRRSETFGRYVAAKEPLRRGDVLFSEEPYAWIALPGDLSVCEGCCATRVNYISCGTCSRALYCGAACRARAAAHHRWECAAAQADLFPTIGIAHLALRVLLVAASAGFPAVPPPQRAPATAAEMFVRYAKVDSVKIYREDTPAFYRMFNLVTNFDKMSNSDYVQYALTATLLTLYLESFTGFFDYLPNKFPYTISKKQLYMFASALILRSLGQLVCNGHAALSLEPVDEGPGRGRTLGERELRRATAIYPSAAMMNHSCDPNIINTFHKTRLIIRCARELSAGHEVLNCYGPHRARSPTAQRRAVLRAQYQFTCNCAACCDVEHRDFVLLFSAYACQACKGPVLAGAGAGAGGGGRRAQCQQCRADFQPGRAAAALDRADELQAQADRASTMEQRLERAHAALRVRQQVWHRHHTGLRAAADQLARLYADAGDYTKSVELIKQNIQSLEYQFGSFSVEVAHELRKLADVMLERMVNCPRSPDYRDWCLETHKIIKKAVQLMELNYGSWEPLVKRLKGQETLVASQLAESRALDSVDCVHNTLHYNLKI